MSEQPKILYICDYGQTSVPICVDLEHEHCKLKSVMSKKCTFRAVVNLDDYKRLQEENKRLQMLSCANCGEKYLSPEGSELYDKNVQLQKENEELKNRLKTLDDEEFVYEVSEIEYNNFKKMNEYKQALEKIKKWATNHNPCDIDPEVKCTKKDCFECLNYDIKKITKTIDEVLK